MCGPHIRSFELSNEKEPLERVDRLIEDCISDNGQPPSKIVVKYETWNWFATVATAETDTRIRWDRGRLMYGGIRITWVR